ncbi:MAG: DUF2723 domain-containing protein [Bacteroidales bacterium]
MDQLSYKKINNILGWLAFGFATAIYLMTIEPTVSFWDCGERLACAYKLQVPHPPGAPLYQMLARVFSLFSFGDVSMAAFWINAMSAVMGGLSIMFLFWTITMLAKKIVQKSGEVTKTKAIAIFGAGLVGALTLTFSDSFWFTAVEAEVYVTSVFLTALVFWIILKWESSFANTKDNLKWLVLISFIVGLSIGVHMLNLLAIPAIVFVFYFKKYNPTRKGVILAGVVAFALLGFIQGVLVPTVVRVDWWFERFFVNVVGMPFQSGTIIYFILLISAIVFGLYYTHKHKKVVANTVILCIMFIIIGYSSFFMLIIRSNANVPINENAPKDALSLQAYLGREQYGSWPLLYGPYYNAPVIDAEDGKPVYRKDKELGKYVVSNERKNTEYVYDPRFTTVFPRMHSSRGIHPMGYEQWLDIQGTPIKVDGRRGEQETIVKPTFTENIEFFFKYQLNHMYLRYLMWNFSGRQNDIQGHGSPLRGNWLSLPFIDNLRIGPQSDLPETMTSNPGYSRYFMLPFILGVIGFLYQLRKSPKGALIVGLLFFMTGIAIIIYLNQTPYQPRERDYSYIGSFYAFAIWVGLGALALSEFLSKFLKSKVAPIAASTICLLAVPLVMAKENWNNHDRSGRYITRDIAINYLESCAPNAVLFTNGDNDTFPLWYAQEVEGIRTDIKIINMSLVNTDWYIDEMARRKTYEADGIPMSMDTPQYRDGTRDFVFFLPELQGYHDVESVVNFIASDNSRTKKRLFEGDNERYDYSPTKNFSLKVDKEKVLANGTVAPEDSSLIVDDVRWTINDNGINKNGLVLLDFLAQNEWERPVYFAITTGNEVYFGLEDYFQLEGLTYRLVPIKAQIEESQEGSRVLEGRINTGILYDNVMNKFELSNFKDPEVYVNEDGRRLGQRSLRTVMQNLADQLIAENKIDSAIAVLDKAVEMLPEYNLPYGVEMVSIARSYYDTGSFEKGNEIMSRMLDIADQELKYYFSFKGSKANLIEEDKYEKLAVLQRIASFTDVYDQEELAIRSDDLFRIYYNMYMSGY